VLGDTEGGDKSVMIVAAKVDQVDAVCDAVASAGFSPELVDVAPIALTNAVRAARPDEADGCLVILDIGARTTSLVIVEGDKLYNRSIPVAGNAITKEISVALGCSLEEAEQVKFEKGYVSVGGVTEDEDEVADRVKWSGVARMLQPKRYGGMEAHPVDFMEAVLATGTADAATGWVAGVVGVLQMDVLEYRLKSEYGVNIVRESLPFRYVRWIEETPRPVDRLRLTSTTTPAVDRSGRAVLLFENEWSIRLALENNEGLKLAETADRTEADVMD